MEDDWSYNYVPSPGLWKSPSPSTISLMLASNNPMNGMTEFNFSGRITPDMINTMRRSRTRSIGHANSPNQVSFSNFLTMGSPGFISASPLTSFCPLSAGLVSQSRPRTSNGLPITSHSNIGSPLVTNRRTPPFPANEVIVTARTQRPQTVPRGPRFKSSQWESHKARIKQLFMDEDKSLEETMRTMEKDHAFSPSKKQYNNKFKQWGFIKNISGATATWMANKAKARKRDGKETEFSVGGQPWTMDRIERSAKRAKIEGNEAAIFDPNTPQDVRWGTPCMGPPPNPAPLKSTTSPKARWDPPSSSENTAPSFLRLQWNGRNKANLDNDHIDAQRLAGIGQTQDAEDKYVQALGGFQGLLGPTHSETCMIAYEFAEFYAENDRMGDADRVLDWMGEKHLERWGIDHKNVRAHVIKVADMLQSWSRDDDAVLMLSRAADCYGKSVRPPHLDVAATGPQLNARMQSDRDYLRLPPILNESLAPNDDDKIRMDYQLRATLAGANTEDPGTEEALIGLCEKCERFPGKLALQIFEARRGLIGFYKNSAMLQKLSSALSQIPESIRKVFKSDAKRTELLLDAAIELIKGLVEEGRQAEAEPLLLLLQKETVETFGDDDGMTISVLIKVGILFQEQGCWSNARPRFEEALAASMTTYGMRSKMTLTLEEALYQKSYSASPPSSKDVGRKGCIHRWNTKTLGHVLGCEGTGQTYL